MTDMAQLQETIAQMQQQLQLLSEELVKAQGANVELAKSLDE